MPPASLTRLKIRGARKYLRHGIYTIVRIVDISAWYVYPACARKKLVAYVPTHPAIACSLLYEGNISALQHRMERDIYARDSPRALVLFVPARIPRTASLRSYAATLESSHSLACW